jgi:hypothetical protein
MVSPGWYQDPSGEQQLRWWDGHAWTSAVHPMATPSPGPGYISPSDALSGALTTHAESAPQSAEPQVYKGQGCTVTLDAHNETITLDHRMGATKALRDVSPWIVPLGSIQALDWKEPKGLRSGYVRLILRGWEQKTPDERSDDVNSFSSGAAKLAPFVARLEHAIRTTSPITWEATPPWVPQTPIAFSAWPHSAESATATSEEDDLLKSKLDALRIELEQSRGATARAEVETTECRAREASVIARLTELEREIDVLRCQKPQNKTAQSTESPELGNAEQAVLEELTSRFHANFVS